MPNRKIFKNIFEFFLKYKNEKKGESSVEETSTTASPRANERTWFECGKENQFGLRRPHGFEHVSPTTVEQRRG